MAMNRASHDWTASTKATDSIAVHMNRSFKTGRTSDTEIKTKIRPLISHELIVKRVCEYVMRRDKCLPAVKVFQNKLSGGLP